MAEHVTVRGGRAAVAHGGGHGGGVVLDAALERLLSTKAARRFLTPQLLARVGRCVRVCVCVSTRLECVACRVAGCGGCD